MFLSNILQQIQPFSPMPRTQFDMYIFTLIDDTITQCCFDAVPSSTTVAQQLTNIRSLSVFCCVILSQGVK